jgi:hypothetical protein
MYRSWEKHSLESDSGGSFSRIRRDTAPALPVAAANSARTTVPRATTAYKIAMEGKEEEIDSDFDEGGTKLDELGI